MPESEDEAFVRRALAIERHGGVLRKIPEGSTQTPDFEERHRSELASCASRGCVMMRPSGNGFRHPATDAEVIEAAVTTPRLTSRANQVGGLGLKHIREWVCGRGGRLTVVSLGAKVVWSGTKVSRRKGPRLRGTAVEIDFRPTDRFVRTEEEFRIF